MTPFVLGLNSPGPRLGSTVRNRSAPRLMAVIAEHHHRGVERYRPRDVDGLPGNETWCNLFAQDVAEVMACVLPRYMRANELVLWLASQPAQYEGWEQVTGHVAQRMADEGQLALAGWYNRNGGPGHIAVMAPALGEPGLWCAQAGVSNFTRNLVTSGFGSRDVTFFGHP